MNFSLAILQFETINISIDQNFSMTLFVFRMHRFVAFKTDLWTERLSEITISGVYLPHFPISGLGLILVRRVFVERNL